MYYEKHPLYQMGQAFIDHDIKAEAKQIEKKTEGIIEYELNKKRRSL